MAKKKNKKKRKLIRVLFRVLLIAALAVVALIVGCQIAVTNASKGRLYSNVDDIPHREVAMLLGTNPIGRTGLPNKFFLRRIDATVDLYEAGKINRIIISGDKHEDYDEPGAMREALLERGLPDSIIILDGEGQRTINSVLGAKQTFGADSLTIISQRFHNERTLFLAKHLGVDAIAYNAANTSSRQWRIRMFFRECLSRVKAVLEIIEYKNNKKKHT